MPVAPAHSRYAVFALKNPSSHRAELFIARSLPFGATASVHGHNKAAMALHFLLHENAGVQVRTISAITRSSHLKL